MCSLHARPVCPWYRIRVFYHADNIVSVESQNTCNQKNISDDATLNSPDSGDIVPT